MKKLFITSLLLLPLWGAGGLFAQSVSVENTSVDYNTQTLTVETGWAAGSRDDLHRDSVWVFVDYQPVAGDGSAGAWARATLTNADATDGMITAPSGWPAAGFFLRGDPSGAFASTLTLTLDGLSGHFNACVYVSDFPPNAILKNDGSGNYRLRGTKPFTVNDVPLAATDPRTENWPPDQIIFTITDLTGCNGFACMPGIIDGTTIHCAPIDAGIIGN